MEQPEEVVKKLVELMGFTDFRVEVKPERKRASVFIYNSEALIKENLLMIVDSINHLVRMIAKKHNQPAIFFDINNYRQERENLIAELARAAAKKVLQTKEHIQLPAMNSYERRLVHVELAVHPEVTTESAGLGKDRYVVIKPIADK